MKNGPRRSLSDGKTRTPKHHRSVQSHAADLLRNSASRPMSSSGHRLFRCPGRDPRFLSNMRRPLLANRRPGDHPARKRRSYRYPAARPAVRATLAERLGAITPGDLEVSLTNSGAERSGRVKRQGSSTAADLLSTVTVSRQDTGACPDWPPCTIPSARPPRIATTSPSATSTRWHSADADGDDLPLHRGTIQAGCIIPAPGLPCR